MFTGNSLFKDRVVTHIGADNHPENTMADPQQRICICDRSLNTAQLLTRLGNKETLYKVVSINHFKLWLGQRALVGSHRTARVEPAAGW